MNIQKPIYCFLLMCMLMTFSCKSTQNVLDDFTDLSVKVNVALQVKLVLRTEDIIPDHFYIQNTQTYKLYEMTRDSKNLFYYEGLPVGTYRVGYWLAEHNTGSPVFKCGGFADNFVTIAYNKDAPANVSLGIFYGHYAVSNLNVKCKKTSLRAAHLTLDNHGSFNAINEECYINKDIKDSVIFAKYGTGKAEYYDDDYVKLSTLIQQMASYESETVKAYLHIIDKEYRKKGIIGATDLINGFRANRNSEFLIVKLAQLYYSEGEYGKASEIITQMYNKNINFAEYYGLLALDAYKTNDFEKAATYFYKAVSLGSRWANVYDSFAKMLVKQNNIELADKLSNYALSIDGNNVGFLQTNLEIAELKKDKKKAAKLTGIIKTLQNGGLR